MGTIKHIWACECGAETECEPEDMGIGACFRCPACQTAWGCIYPKRGGKAWFRLDESSVKFHRLFDEPEPDED